MIVKKTKQLGNFKKGINLYIPRRSSGGPSGFPNVGADGQQVFVANIGIFTKFFDEYVAQFVSASTMYGGPYIANGNYYFKLLFNVGANQWEIGHTRDTGNGDEWFVEASNPSSNQNVIPTTGWSDGGTITTVPSGIYTVDLMAVNINIQGNNLYARLRNLNEGGDYPSYSVADGYWNIGAGNDNVPVTRLIFSGGQWAVISSNSFEPPFDNITNSSPNQLLSFIPTSNWSQSITITAA
jgi:hypothetical protein